LFGIKGPKLEEITDPKKRKAAKMQPFNFIENFLGRDL